MRGGNTRPGGPSQRRRVSQPSRECVATPWPGPGPVLRVPAVGCWGIDTFGRLGTGAAGAGGLKSRVSVTYRSLTSRGGGGACASNRVRSSQSVNTSTDRRAYPGAGLGRVGVDDRDRVGSLAHQRDTARVPGIADAARNAVSAEPLLLQRVHCPARGVLARLPKAGQRNPGGPALALDNRQDPAVHTTGHLPKPKTRLLRITEPPRRPGHLLPLIQPGHPTGHPPASAGHRPPTPPPAPGAAPLPPQPAPTPPTAGSGRRADTGSPPTARPAQGLQPCAPGCKTPSAH